MEGVKNTIQIVKANGKVILVDVLVFAFILIIPAISHLVPFPLYLIEPMRIALLMGYFLSRNTYNGFFLAISIPLFSTLITGHPVLLKSTLIAAELGVNIAFFYLLFYRMQWGVFSAIITSIVLSKVFYYGCKFIFLQNGWLKGSLISTGLESQAITLTIISVVLWLLFRNTFKNE